MRKTKIKKRQSDSTGEEKIKLVKHLLIHPNETLDYKRITPRQQKLGITYSTNARVEGFNDGASRTCRKLATVERLHGILLHIALKNFPFLSPTSLFH